MLRHSSLRARRRRPGARPAALSRRLPALASIVLLAFAALACGSTLDESLTDLEVGDCVASPGSGQQEVDSLESVDCAEPGAITVVDVFDVEGFSDWPGLDEVQSQAFEGCPATTIFTLYPTEDSWNSVDDRAIICFE